MQFQLYFHIKKENENHPSRPNGDFDYSTSTNLNKRMLMEFNSRYSHTTKNHGIHEYFSHETLHRLISY